MIEALKKELHIVIDRNGNHSTQSICVTTL